jgi:hypothetical protein
MNAAKTKLLTWTAAGTLGVGLSLYVVYNLQRLKEIQAPVSTERMTQVLSDTPAIVEKADNIVPYDQVNASLSGFDWTGKPPPEPTAVVAPPPPPKATELGVDKLVKVLGFKADTRNPEKSKAILKYLPEAKVPAPPATRLFQEGVLKTPGDRLDAPIDHITVLSITEAGVEFGYDDGRESQTLGPQAFDLGGALVYVNPEDVVRRSNKLPIQSYTGSWTNPENTQQIGRNRFRIGVNDADSFARNYAQILSEDVRTRRHKDPTTGKYDGIELTSVSPGSIASRHGAQTGDVIKSINGHAVTSTQEAINFVKNNEGMYEKWEVVVSNMGQERTVTYFPPKE